MNKVFPLIMFTGSKNNTLLSPFSFSEEKRKRSKKKETILLFLVYKEKEAKRKCDKKARGLFC